MREPPYPMHDASTPFAAPGHAPAGEHRAPPHPPAQGTSPDVSAGSSSPSPERTAREPALDVLRGVAILGTLGTNILMFAAVGRASTWLERGSTGLVEHALSILCNGKFLSMLCVLFGVGLALQLESAQRATSPEQRWPGVALRRAAWLLGIGAMHYVFVFEYDVLMSYAVTAMVACAIVHRSEATVRSWLVAAASIYWAAATTVVLVLAALALLADRVSGAQSFFDWFLSPEGLLPNRAYLTQVAWRIEGLWWAIPMLVLGLPQTLMLFLTGVLLWRHGVLREPAQHARLLRRMRIVGLGVALPVTALLSLAPGENWGVVAMLAQRYLLGPIVAAGYLALIVELVRAGALAWLRARLSEVGRAAMTCYIMQNVLAGIVFYRWGLDLGRDAEGPLLLVVLVSLWAVLTLMAWACVRRWGTGPIERAWRRLSA